MLLRSAHHFGMACQICGRTLEDQSEQGKLLTEVSIIRLRVRCAPRTSLRGIAGVEQRRHCQVGLAVTAMTETGVSTQSGSIALSPVAG
jgi:hypothetical protein